MRTCLEFLVALLLYLIVLTNCSVENFGVRGIPKEKANLYEPRKYFSCLDGSSIIPYSYINDDYCDCLDASDEPGTSACTNGTFYCTNTGHFSLILPSSRVNDGICDCCDGSDEWDINVLKNICQNTCKNLQHIVKKERIRINNLYELGFEKRAQLIVKGKHLLSLKQNTIFQLYSKKRDAQFIRNNALADKETAENKEKRAIHEEKLKLLNETIKIFNEIDTNKNNKIEMEEVISYSIFDQNNDGLVSEDEINYFMEGKTMMDIKDFISNGWKRVKLLTFTKSNNLNKDINFINKNEEYTIEDKVFRINKLLYTEKTKIIIDDLKKARELFEEADQRVKDIQRKIYKLQKSIGKNFGPDYEFAAFDEQCYEIADLKYIYKLCLFEKVTQRSVNGGPEVNLGVWKDWINVINGEQKYHTMLYDEGQYCLNNHQRFTQVHLSCGLEPNLISVEEPNRCEYIMVFELPSVCVLQDKKYSREEL